MARLLVRPRFFSRLLRAVVVGAAVSSALAVLVLVGGLAFSPGTAAASVATPPASSATPVLGDAGSFWAKDFSTGDYRQLDASIAYVGEHSLVYVENGQTVPTVTIDRLGQEFDSRVYPQVTSVLGAGPDPGPDNDPRLVILIGDLRDPTRAVEGYFNPADLTPETDETHSNRRDMIYLDAQSVAAEPQNAGALAAHEFAHLIVYYRHYVLNPSPDRAPEPSWLAEGISAYAEHLAGYDERVDSQLLSFTNDPATDLTSWADTREHYGASYAFISYLAAREGQDFIGALIDDPADGITGINDALRTRGVNFDTFDTLFNDWIITNFLDGRPPQVPTYSYAGITLSATSSAVIAPLPKIASESLSNFGAVYLDFPATAPDSVFTVTVEGSGAAPLRAALISWDSAGILPPDVRFLTFKSEDANISAATGRDRHTLVVWARGVVGDDALYTFLYAAAVDPPGGIQFLDLPPSSPYYTPVTQLLARHVISGMEVPPGSGLWYFDGTNNLTRAQFAKMIMEATGLHTLAIDSPDAPTFRDVRLTYDQSGQSQAYPYDYVEEAAGLAIINGYPDGTFRPNNPITRGQLALMIARGARAAGKPLPAYSGSSQVFADVPPSSTLYRDVMAAYAVGILSGSTGPDGRRYFYPYSSATRYQVAKMTANLLQFLDTVG